jgi:hypothetical protein
MRTITLLIILMHCEHVFDLRSPSANRQEIIGRCQAVTHLRMAIVNVAWLGYMWDVNRALTLPSVNSNSWSLTAPLSFSWWRHRKTPRRWQLIPYWHGSEPEKMSSCPIIAEVPVAYWLLHFRIADCPQRCSSVCELSPRWSRGTCGPV